MVRQWIDKEYRFLMLGAMAVELFLLGWLVAIEQWGRR